jgi:DNA-binding XRE family transcriptional regulator
MPVEISQGKGRTTDISVDTWVSIRIPGIEISTHGYRDVGLPDGDHIVHQTLLHIERGDKDPQISVKYMFSKAVSSYELRVDIKQKFLARLFIYLEVTR